MPKSEVLFETDKCTWCGSTETLGKRILFMAKAKGLVTPNFTWYPIVQQLQPPIDPLKTPLIGSLFPTGVCYMDICLKCGKTFTVKIVEAEALIQNIQRS